MTALYRSFPQKKRGFAKFVRAVRSFLQLDLPNYTPEECPICKEGKLPLVHLGSRKMKKIFMICIPLTYSTVAALIF